MNIINVEQAIGIPAERWEGNCFGVASMMVENMDIDGKAVYGLWLGDIAPGSVFSGRAITHHGWIRCPDGMIIDPTRWVFEGREPYIYLGESDHYDEGGISLKFKPQIPDYDESRNIDYDFGEEAWIYDLLLNSNKVSIPQMFYLANLPPQEIGVNALKIYQHVEKAGFRAFVPVDYCYLCDIHK